MKLRSANIKYTVIMMMAALVICWGPMITWNILRYFEGGDAIRKIKKPKNEF